MRNPYVSTSEVRNPYGEMCGFWNYTVDMLLVLARLVLFFLGVGADFNSAAWLGANLAEAAWF